MKIYTILENDGNVKVLKSMKSTVQFLTNYGDRKIYENGNRKMILLEKKDIEWAIKENEKSVFHSGSMSADYRFRVQTHNI